MDNIEHHHATKRAYSPISTTDQTEDDVEPSIELHGTHGRAWSSNLSEVQFEQGDRVELRSTSKLFLPRDLVPEETTFRQIPTPHETRSRGTLMSSFPRSLSFEPLKGARSRVGTFGKIAERIPRRRLPLLVILSSIFSSVFSGIYLVLALRPVQYQGIIGPTGHLSLSTASLISALIAKLIEITFVTAFIAFIGQVLSYKACSSHSKGVRMAELDAKTWIVQPGSMLRDFRSLRHGFATAIGVWSLLVTLATLFYTTAANALVAPHIISKDSGTILLQGPIRTAFGNAEFRREQCRSPGQQLDPALGPEVCLATEMSAQAFWSLQQYLALWGTPESATGDSSSLAERPTGVYLLFQNTTVNSSWVLTEDSMGQRMVKERLVNNVSLAIPHAGVMTAAYDARNRIAQPSDVEGLGGYLVKASVVNPVANVLCVNIEEADIANITYALSQEGRDHPLTWKQWLLGEADFTDLNDFKLETPLDDIFGWGPSYDGSGFPEYPPMFYKVPLPYNTILNQTFLYGRRSIYALLKAGSRQDEQLTLCQLRTYLTSNCSTEFSTNSVGASLGARCGDVNNDLQYSRSLGRVRDGDQTLSRDWPWIASGLFGALSLNDGINDGNSTTSRLLTEFISTRLELDPRSPSPAEALAVVAGSSLVTASLYAPFVDFYNYTLPILDSPQYQVFNASVSGRQYTNGPTFAYQKALFPVLFTVFISNIFVLVFFIFYPRFILDFSDPQTLFILAMNSPQTEPARTWDKGETELSTEDLKAQWVLVKDGERLSLKQNGGNYDADIRLRPVFDPDCDQS